MKSLVNESLIKSFKNEFEGISKDFSMCCLGTYEKRRDNLVFIHGFGSWHKIFIPFVEHLTGLKEKMNFILFDLHGHGSTDLGKEVKASIELFARQTKTLIDFFAADSTNIIAHSMGGAVAVILHKMYPELKINKFVNLEGNLLHWDCTVSKQVCNMGREEFLNGGMEKMKTFIKGEAEKGSVSFADYYESFSTAKPNHLFDSGYDLFRITPILYDIYLSWDVKSLNVFGIETLKTPCRNTFEQLLTDGKEASIINGAGHCMMLEKPMETARVVREFLEK